MFYAVSAQPKAAGESDKRQIDFPHPERELLYWAILFNRRELAHLFWKLGQDHVGENFRLDQRFPNF